MTPLPGRLVLLGHPVAHSLSPTFQNAALDAAGLAVRYEALDVSGADLGAVVRQLRRIGAAGNVTVPHKEAMAALCDELTPEARRVGAVNAFRAIDGRLIGHNTDVAGFRAAAESLASVRDAVVGVFGAGGAAAAVLAALIDGQVPVQRVLVANRDTERARALCERYRYVARVSDADEIARTADLVVNATSLGMVSGEPGPIDPALLLAHARVLDLVYSPDETVFVRAARARGLHAADGLVMLVEQGAAAFEWWFGVPPDRDVMWRSLGRTP